MEGKAVHRLRSARSAVILGVLVFALNISGLVLVAMSGEPAAQLVRLTALLPTVAVGTLVAARRPADPRSARIA